jgi:hypothetical protein
VGSRLFPTATLAARLPRLLPAVIAVVAIRGRPGGQDRECLPAKRAPAPANPDPVVLSVVGLFPPAPVADDRRLPAHRTPARQLRQADRSYPGSLLSSVDGSAIKRITAGVKACRWSSRQVRSGDRPSPSCTDQCRTKKNNGIWRVAPAPSTPNIGRYLATRQDVSWSGKSRLRRKPPDQAAEYFFSKSVRKFRSKRLP